MSSDGPTYSPFAFFEDEPGSFTLMLSDTSMIQVMDVFDRNGRYGNGYAWTDVALQAMRTTKPELESRIEMDPEAGAFVAHGRDPEALRELAALLHAAFHDHERLAELVASAPFEFD